MSVRKSVLSLVRISTVTNPDVATFLRVENKHVLHSNSSDTPTLLIESNVMILSLSNHNLFHLQSTNVK